MISILAFDFSDLKIFYLVITKWLSNSHIEELSHKYVDDNSKLIVNAKIFNRTITFAVNGDYYINDRCRNFGIEIFEDGKSINYHDVIKGTTTIVEQYFFHWFRAYLFNLYENDKLILNESGDIVPKKIKKIEPWNIIDLEKNDDYFISLSFTKQNEYFVYKRYYGNKGNSFIKSISEKEAEDLKNQYLK